MTTETKNIIAWNGETYKGLGGIFELLQSEDFLEYTEDYDQDELLRIALWAWNGNYSLVPEDVPTLASEESEFYMGEASSYAAFTEQLIGDTDLLDLDFPSWVVIDYEATWHSTLQHEFFSYDVVTIDGEYKKLFWRAG